MKPTKFGQKIAIPPACKPPACKPPASSLQASSLQASSLQASSLQGLARIGVTRALNRHVERTFDPSRKDTHWGRRKLARDR